MQDLFDKFETFTVPDFPPNESSVYVILCVKGNEEIPIYIGEASKLRRRIGGYISASFQLFTDFKVGEAIRYLQEEEYKVVIKYKSTKEEFRKEEEKSIIDNLHGEGYRLLNDLGSYNYRTASKEEERLRIRSFSNDILKIFANRSHSC